MLTDAEETEEDVANIKGKLETVQKYNILMREFPVGEVESAPDLPAIAAAIAKVFDHMKKHLIRSSYPVARAAQVPHEPPRCPVYLLYWYKSTNAPAVPSPAQPRCLTNHLAAQFTCFTGTKVQILGYPVARAVQVPREAARCAVYLLYWHKSTNTDLL
jgi:hypothetical protein